MGKRKRVIMGQDEAGDTGAKGRKKAQTTSLPKSHGETSYPSTSTVQIIVGTYDKVVHGLTATILEKTPNGITTQAPVEFVDNFLLHAHDAAVRCLALSPPKSDKILFASASSDQEIQVYQLSTQIQSILGTDPPALIPSREASTAHRTGNKSLGTLGHHEGAVNALCFPSRSKLLSAADDNTIAVTRTRDWTVLSTIKAPIPKAHGRPSGDTAPLGGTPAGVNDIAIHPSMKLMVSVGKGEKCMRLWNLVTGKKAGVLNFEKSVLQGVGEGKWASGEGRRVRWNSIGEEFVVAFDKGCVIYGIDSRPKFRILPGRSTKVHQLRYVPMRENQVDSKEILAISTEDGRILFYSTDSSSAVPREDQRSSEVEQLPPIAHFGGAADGLPCRIKDFEILRLPSSASILFVTCCSDGSIRLWLVEESDLVPNTEKTNGNVDQQTKESPNKSSEAGQDLPASRPIGQLIGLYESKHRITCLAAFLMSEPSNGEGSRLENGGASSSDGKDEATET